MKLYGIDDEIIISGYFLHLLSKNERLIFCQGQSFERLLLKSTGSILCHLLQKSHRLLCQGSRCHKQDKLLGQSGSRIREWLPTYLARHKFWTFTSSRSLGIRKMCNISDASSHHRKCRLSESISQQNRHIHLSSCSDDPPTKARHLDRAHCPCYCSQISLLTRSIQLIVAIHSRLLQHPTRPILSPPFVKILARNSRHCQSLGKWVLRKQRRVGNAASSLHAPLTTISRTSPARQEIRSHTIKRMEVGHGRRARRLDLSCQRPMGGLWRRAESKHHSRRLLELHKEELFFGPRDQCACSDSERRLEGEDGE
jgi:hypothetical protein